MKVSYFLTRPTSETETSIYARLCYAGYKFKFYVPESINPKFWNKATRRAKETQKFKEYPEFNARLNNIEASIKNVYRQYINDNEGTIPNPQTLKELLEKAINKKETIESKKTFFAYYEQFLERSQNGERVGAKSKSNIVRNTTKGYLSTLNHLKAFQEKYSRNIDFDSIDLDFYNDYIKYLTKTVKLSNNTIGDHVKRIKTVLNEATEHGINNNLSFRSKYFIKPTEQTDSIYLSEAEIGEIENLDLADNKRLDSVRDLFLIGCYTGLRYSDYSILKPHNIKDGFIETVQTKTGKPVVIPIHSTVKRILSKYENHLPVSISNQKTNDYLKELGKTIPKGNDEPILNDTVSKTSTKGGVRVTHTYKKWELLTTHTARRSFATNEYLAGTPTITIMAITGHKTEKAFLKYIKLTPNEHAKLLKLHWQKRAKLEVV